ncbi:hypothetical protein Q4571_16925 [Bacillus thuringiensis]|nr:hypothetical protein [Bacillus thuringiensis]
MFFYVQFIFLIYFIHKQFEYERVTILTYTAIPIFSIYNILMLFPELMHKVSISSLITTIVISVLIGYYQASKVKIKETKTITGDYDKDNLEVPIYTKIAFVKGGYRYAIGWICILCAKYVIGAIFNINIHESFLESMWEELLRDIISIFSFQVRHGENVWIDWILVGGANITYVLLLRKRYPAVRNSLKNRGRRKKSKK